MHAPDPAVPPHNGVVVLATVVAASALAGAAGLVTGALDTGATVEGRLPFHSPVFGGLALALIVGLPSAVVAWWARRGDHRTAIGCIGSGVLLVGWIVVEVAIVREISWLQPLYLVLGAVFVLVGRRIEPAPWGRDRVHLPPALHRRSR